MASESSSMDLMQAPQSNYLSISDWAQQNGYGNYSNFFTRLGQWALGRSKSIKEDYKTYVDNYLNNLDIAKDEYFNNKEIYENRNAYQFLVKDLEAAGLNPFMISNASPQVASISSSSSAKGREKDEDDGISKAVMMIALLFAKALLK